MKYNILPLVLVLVSVESLIITDPCCETYNHRVSAFGPAFPVNDNSLIGSRDVIDSLEATLVLQGELCTATATVLNDSIALVPRGGCTFATKVVNSQAAGASAVIVYESNPERTQVVTMSTDILSASGVNIPSVFVSYTTGEALIELLNNGTVLAMINGTGSTEYGVYYYDVQLYTLIAIMATVALLLMILVMTITSCCSLYDGSKQANEIVKGEYNAQQITGGKHSL